MYHTVTGDNIAEVVDTFYGGIRDDQLLGPIFAGAIGTEWGPHLDKIKTLWYVRTACLSGLQRDPMIAHLQLPRLTLHHFERWLQLWRETVAGLCSDELHATTTYHESAVRETAEATRGAL
ncbi:MAG: group III truncated hemoglobin [Bryobacteraceae bacterium]